MDSHKIELSNNSKLLELWQKDTVDLISQNESCFVVAPTAAGKTFVAVNAIHQLLQSHIEQNHFKYEKEHLSFPITTPKLHWGPWNRPIAMALSELPPVSPILPPLNIPKSNFIKELLCEIVLVAPTSSLCYQLMMKVWSTLKISVGLFTEGHQFSLNRCKLLVCTPTCLELLMMSPSLENWRLGLQYVILDNFHSIYNSRPGI